MEEYQNIGVWFAIPTFIVTWLGCLAYAISEYGWFIGTPLGVFIGAFFAGLSALFAAYLWPIIALSLLGLIYLIL